MTTLTFNGSPCARQRSNVKTHLTVLTRRTDSEHAHCTGPSSTNCLMPPPQNNGTTSDDVTAMLCQATLVLESLQPDRMLQVPHRTRCSAATCPLDCVGLSPECLGRLCSAKVAAIKSIPKYWLDRLYALWHLANCLRAFSLRGAAQILGQRLPETASAGFGLNLCWTVCR